MACYKRERITEGYDGKSYQFGIADDAKIINILPIMDKLLKLTRKNPNLYFEFNNINAAAFYDIIAQMVIMYR